MKKLLAILAITFASLPIFADIYIPHRFVEVGVNVDAEAGENMLGLTDIMVKDLVIDLPKIYKEMGPDGFVLSYNQGADVFFDVNINGYGAGVVVSEDISGSLNISSEFFKLLAEGNDMDTEVETSMGLNLEGYINAAVPIHMKFGKLKITATPSYFLPVFYIPNPNAKLTYIINSDGSASARLNADIDLYTAISLAGAIKTDEQGNIIFDQDGLGTQQEIIDNILVACSKNGGIDLGIRGEYPVLDQLDIGAYLNVPVYHGTLRNKLSASAEFTVDMEPLLDYYLHPQEEGQNPWSFSDINDIFSGLTASSAEFHVNRPFRIGLEAAYRPFGNNMVTIHPMLGLAIRNPFGKDFSIDSIIPEYKISADLSLAQILGLSISTEYTNKVFSHALDLFLNTRIVELKASIGTGSSNFFKSFSVSGLKASVGVSIGI